MYSKERKIIEFLEKHVSIILIIVATVLSAGIRYKGREFVSGDIDCYLVPWYNTIEANGGIKALSEQVGDYSIAYQFIIAILTYIPIKAIYAYKLFSAIFDYFLSVGVGLLICELKHNKFVMKDFAVCYSALLFLPSIFINSSYWGQCDAIWVSFIVWGLYMFRKGYITKGFIFWGLSLSFKLQFVFIFPFIIYLYVSEKRFSVIKFLWLPTVLFISTLPGILMGRDWLSFIKIYTSQSSSYEQMTLNAPNYWWVQGGYYDFMKKPAIIMTLMLLTAGLVYIVRYKINTNNNRVFILMACWSVWTVVNFLPSMHERYFYLLDILMFVLVFVDFKQYFKFFCFLMIIAVIVYGRYMFNTNFDPYIPSMAFLVMYSYFSYKVFFECRNCSEIHTNQIEASRSRT